MRRYLLVFAIAFLMIYLATNTFAISTQIKNQYNQGETIITRISGNILSPIDKSQVVLKRGHVEVPFQYDLEKLNGDYYLWAIAPFKSNNYTLEIDGIRTTVSGKVENIDYKKDFYVGKNLTEYNVQPGAIFSKGNFSLIVDNFEDQGIGLGTNFPNQSILFFEPGKTSVEFKVNKTMQGLYNLTLGTYSIPVYIVKTENENSTRTNVLNETNPLKISPNEIDSTIIPYGKHTYPIELINLWNKSIEVSLRYNNSLFSLSSGNDIEIPAEGGYNINISVEDLNENLTNYLYFESYGFETNLPINIFITNNESQESTPYIDNSTKVSLDSCSSLGGFVCSASGETCSGTEKRSLDGVCCIGRCVTKSSGKSYAWIGYLIGVLLLIIIIIVYLKYRKTGSKSKKTLEKLEKAKGLKDGILTKD